MQEQNELVIEDVKDLTEKLPEEQKEEVKGLAEDRRQIEQAISETESEEVKSELENKSKQIGEQIDNIYERAKEPITRATDVTQEGLGVATETGAQGVTRTNISAEEVAPALRDVESTAKALDGVDKEYIKGVYGKLKNVFKKSAIGAHASPYKFNKFKLGINAKRGRAYGHGAYVSAEKNPSAKNFTLMSISEGIDDLGRNIFEKEGVEIGDNPKYKALSLLERALVGTKKGEQNDVKSLIEKESKEGSSSYSGKYNAEDVKLANEYYDKYKSSLKSAYLYEIEYSLDGEMATEGKMSKQSQGVIDALRRLPKEYQNLVDKAIESDMNFNSFYDLLSYNLPKTKDGGINQKIWVLQQFIYHQ